MNGAETRAAVLAQVGALSRPSSAWTFSRYLPSANSSQSRYSHFSRTSLRSGRPFAPGKLAQEQGEVQAVLVGVRGLPGEMQVLRRRLRVGQGLPLVGRLHQDRADLRLQVVGEIMDAVAGQQGGLGRVGRAEHDLRLQEAEAAHVDVRVLRVAEGGRPVRPGAVGVIGIPQAHGERDRRLLAGLGVPGQAPEAGLDAGVEHFGIVRAAGVQPALDLGDARRVVGDQEIALAVAGDAEDLGRVALADLGIGAGAVHAVDAAGVAGADDDRLRLGVEINGIGQLLRRGPEGFDRAVGAQAIEDALFANAARGRRFRSWGRPCRSRSPCSTAGPERP